MFVDLDWPLNASSLLSASAELLVYQYKQSKAIVGVTMELMFVATVDCTLPNMLTIVLWIHWLMLFGALSESRGCILYTQTVIFPLTGSQKVARHIITRVCIVVEILRLCQCQLFTTDLWLFYLHFTQTFNQSPCEEKKHNRHACISLRRFQTVVVTTVGHVNTPV